MDRYYRNCPKYDAARLNELFKLLRKEGLIARQNFSCCGGCAGSELATYYGELCDAGKGDKIKGVAFYHQQDAETLRCEGGTYLAYGEVSHWDSEAKAVKYKSPLSTEEVGRVIERCCRQLNMMYEWDGNPSTRFWVQTDEDLVGPPPSFIGEGI